MEEEERQRQDERLTEEEERFKSTVEAEAFQEQEKQIQAKITNDVFETLFSTPRENKAARLRKDFGPKSGRRGKPAASVGEGWIATERAERAAAATSGAPSRPPPAMSSRPPPAVSSRPPPAGVGAAVSSRPPPTPLGQLGKLCFSGQLGRAFARKPTPWTRKGLPVPRGPEPRKPLVRCLKRSRTPLGWQRATGRDHSPPGLFDVDRESQPGGLSPTRKKSRRKKPRRSLLADGLPGDPIEESEKESEERERIVLPGERLFRQLGRQLGEAKQAEAASLATTGWKLTPSPPQRRCQTTGGSKPEEKEARQVSETLKAEKEEEAWRHMARWPGEESWEGEDIVGRHPGGDNVGARVGLWAPASGQQEERLSGEEDEVFCQTRCRLEEAATQMFCVEEDEIATQMYDPAPGIASGSAEGGPNPRD